MRVFAGAVMKRWARTKGAWGTTHLAAVGISVNVGNADVYAIRRDAQVTF